MVKCFLYEMTILFIGSSSHERKVRGCNNIGRNRKYWKYIVEIYAHASNCELEISKNDQKGNHKYEDTYLIVENLLANTLELFPNALHNVA